MAGDDFFFIFSVDKTQYNTIQTFGFTSVFIKLKNENLKINYN